MTNNNIVKVFIRPANHCNFICKHCFLDKEILKKEELSINDVKCFFDLLVKDFSIIFVRFHGGEPTLVGKEYYRELFSYQKKLSEKFNVVFNNTIQTNGLLLDEEYIQILMDANSTIGISYDGNHNNVLRPHSEEVYERINLLKKSKARFSAICVETEKSVENLFETYEWFQKESIHFKFHPILPRGFAKRDHSLTLNIENYVSKISQLYTHWLKDLDCKIHISTFEEFMQIRNNQLFKKRWFERNKFSLNSDGKLYVFGYPNEINYALGSVRDFSSIKEVFSVPNYRKLQTDIEEIILEKCSFCSVKDICGGTCICSSFLFDDNEQNISYSCELARQTFEVILKINLSVEEDFSIGNIQKYNKYVRKYYESL